MGYEWTAEEEDDFEPEAITGKVIADGTTEYVNQGKAKKGTVLYRIVWKVFPPDMVWYEPAENPGEMGYLQSLRRALPRKQHRGCGGCTRRGGVRGPGARDSRRCLIAI